MDVARLDQGTALAQSRGLVLAALGDPAADPAIGDDVLSEAAALGVDPLDYCAHTLGRGDDALRDAAHWAGFAFSAVVPRDLSGGRPRIDRLDHLANVRTLRTTLFERGVTFCAPHFDELLRLAQARLANPELARHLCIVPARAIRAQLANACTDELLDEARQRLTRRWPYASANVDLPAAVRIAFARLVMPQSAARDLLGGLNRFLRRGDGE